ncbi:uncharacterized protein PAC_11202 [Phialocephala subalpina]|uniref:2EXR domain-containing protein n=1 Tax=Phialocephala subalpina TaxID=576137 RepID=A0A1L7X8I6_9HELO|nr:uncharacterized protein PAC_11202 [Phialocephala subalpina]
MFCNSLQSYQIKFPLEIQRKVWKLLLPKPRHVLICAYEDDHRERDRLHRAARNIPLPNTLYICSDSRAETLRKYCLVWWMDLGREQKDWRRPICFDWERDLPYIVGESERVPEDPGLLSHFMMLLRSAYCEHMKKVTRLEVREFDQNSQIHEIILPQRIKGASYDPYPAPSQAHYEGQDMYFGFMRKEPPLDGVLQLSGLKHVTFRYTINAAMGPSRFQSDFDKRKKMITTYLSMHKHRFKEQKVPEVMAMAERKHYPRDQ